MKTLITSFLLFFTLCLHAGFDTRTYANVAFYDLNVHSKWLTTGVHAEGDTCIIRIKTFAKEGSGKNEIIKRKVFEYKYFFKNHQELSFFLSDPDLLINKEKSSLLAEAQIAGMSLCKIYYQRDKSAKNGIILNEVYGKPIDMLSYDGVDYEKPGIEVFYKVQTMPAIFVDLKYWTEVNTVYVQWTTSNEKDVDVYYLLRMDKEGNYDRIDSVRAANTGSITHYVCFDRTPEPDNIYMIQGKDVNYTNIFTDAFSVSMNIPDPVVMISPNPGSEFMNIAVSTLNNTQVTLVKVVNVSGSAVLEQELNPGEEKLDISGLEPGVYSIYLDNVFVQRFIKN